MSACQPMVVVSGWPTATTLMSSSTLSRIASASANVRSSSMTTAVISMVRPPLSRLVAEQVLAGRKDGGLEPGVGA
jgi:hypothetical protein